MSAQLPQRPLGSTGHNSSVLAFGGAAVGAGDRDQAAEAIRLALAHGINHFDVAPMYGEAEATLGDTLGQARDAIFLACKTTQRKRFKAQEELDRSLQRLRTDHLDLYQCHSVSSPLDLDQLLGPRGALELFQAARESGKVRFLGITGHHCGVLRRAIEEFAFDTVMCPINSMQAAQADEASDFGPLLETATRRGVGVIAIKAIARRPWPNGAQRSYTTWYEPWDDEQHIRQGIDFALSHAVATTVLPSDVSLWPAILHAALETNALDVDELDARVRAAEVEAPLYVQQVVPARQAWQG